MSAPVQVAGHLGELLQGRLGPEGPLALITLPCPGLSLRLERAPGAFALAQPQEGVIRQDQVAAIFRHCNRPLAGRWRLSAAMPVGAGAGASTAALLAFCRALAPALPAAEFAALALRLEGASDPLAHPRPERLLWASREARVLSALPAPPRLRVVGGFAGAGERTDPQDLHFPDIADLVAAWPVACRDPAALGALVSESSRRSMALRGKPGFAELAAIALQHGAHGVAIAHTGSARGFLLDPSADPAPLLAALDQRGWSHLQSFILGDSHA